MKLKSLFMEGFKTFAEPQTFDFTEYPDDGLCFVTGKNDVDPELGANGTGKCLPTYTILQDAVTGERKTIQEWQSSFNAGKELHVWGLGYDHQLTQTKVTDIFETGEKKVLRVHLADGSYQDVSETHPIITSIGQMEAQQLATGDLVMAPRHLRASEPLALIPDDLLTVSALFMAMPTLLNLADAKVTDATLLDERMAISRGVLAKYGLGIEVTTADNESPSARLIALNPVGSEGFVSTVRRLKDLCTADLEPSIARSGWSLAETQGIGLAGYKTLMGLGEELTGDVLSIAKELFPLAALVYDLDAFNLLPDQCTAHDVTNALQACTDAQLAAFVKLWIVERYAPSLKCINLGVTEGAVDRARTLKALLLRLGVAAKVTTVPQGTILRPAGKTAQLRLNEILGIGEVDTSKTREDAIPSVLVNHLLAAAAKESGVDMRFEKFQKETCYRDKLQEIADATNSSKLNEIAKADVVWHRVEKVEVLGTQPTMDISVEIATHLYALDSIITHNSSVFDGLCYALYGKTSRGLKAGDVASWQVAHGLEDKAQALEADGKKRPSQKALTPSVTNRVAFENYNGDTCTINRRWNPNVLTLQVNDGEPKNVDQKQIDNMIGYNFDEFLQAAYFSQFQDLFLDMSSTERSALVAKVLNLDIWDKYSDEAKKEADVIKKKVEEGRSGIERIKGQIEELEGQDFAEQTQEWDDNHAEELAGLKADLAAHEASEEGINEKVTKADGAVGKARDTLDDQQAAVEDHVAKETQPLRNERADAVGKLETKLDKANNDLTDLEDQDPATNEPEGLAELEKQVTALDKAVAKHEGDLDRIDADIAGIEKKEAKVKKLEGDCSACGQPISEEHVDHELEQLEKQVVALEDKADDIDTELRQANRDLRAGKKKVKELKAEAKQGAEEHKAKLRKVRDVVKGINTELKETQRDFDDRIADLEQEARKESQEQLAELNSAVTDAEKALTSAKASSKEWKRVRNDLRDDVLDCEDDVNPHKKQQEKNKKRLAALNTEREEAFTELEKIVEGEAASRYWVKGFKSVKLFAVSSALNELEAEVNSALDGLGLGGWSVEFDVDKETKKGTLSKGFFAFINSADNLEPVKWEAWSGGESQRLRLAASLGLANMIRASKGLELPFEIWDEPSQWMSDSGITGLLDVLQRRARRLNRQIWLIDHRGLEYPFDAAIEITKTYDGSTIKNVSQSFTGVSSSH